jgi:transcriptional regulator with XRE-family HTH domain
MDTKQQIGRQIKSLRQARALTQEQVAERTRLSVNYLSRIERGLENPTLDTLLSVAECLQVDPQDLFAIQDDSPKRLRQTLSRLAADTRDDQLNQAIRVLRALLR